MNKYFEEWLNTTLPELRKEYNIREGKGTQTDAKRIAYIVTESFLKHIPLANIQRVLGASDLLNQHIYNLAYEHKLRCDSIPQERRSKGRVLISLNQGYREKPDHYDSIAITIIQTLKDIKK